MLKEVLRPLGFSQHEATCYFVRDRGSVRDAILFQKMRANSICFAYGLSIKPELVAWTPCLQRAKWLEDQAFFNVKYEEHVSSSIERAISAIEREAIPYFYTFRTLSDLQE